MIEKMKEEIYSLLSPYHFASESENILCHILLLTMALLLSLMVGYLFRKIVAPLLLKLVKKTDTVWDDYLLNKKLIHQTCRIIPGFLFYILLPFCLPSNNVLFSFIVEQISKIYIVITVISASTVFLDNIETFTKEEEKLKEKHLYGIIEFLKIVIYFVGGIIIISFLLGQNPLSMVAGIGAAATVLMLVFKDSILGLVAGIQLSVNRMIKPGDWITIEKSKIDGVVEKVSLTTVKVRNFDNTIYTVPPYSLISETFQNWSSMYQGGGRRMKRALYIDMNSIGICNADVIQNLIDKQYISVETGKHATNKVNLTLFREYVRDYLKTQPYIVKEKTILARQLAPTPNGLPLEFYFFLNLTNFIDYEAQCAECMEHFIAVLPDFNLRVFQSPTGWDIKSIHENRN